MAEKIIESFQVKRLEILNGADSATFLSKVVHYLEDPGLLFIESA